MRSTGTGPTLTAATAAPEPPLPPPPTTGFETSATLLWLVCAARRWWKLGPWTRALLLVVREGVVDLEVPVLLLVPPVAAVDTQDDDVAREGVLLG